MLHQDMPAAAGPLGSIRRQATAALMVATAMQAFDATIANVALPEIEQQFGTTMALGSWILSAYLVATAIMTPLTGWLRRRLGGRRLFAFAIGGFVAASLLCTVAPSAAIIIFCRFAQGAAAGLILPLAQSMLLDLHPKERHAGILAKWGAAVMIGPVIGPMLGGFLTEAANWKWIFYINVPLGALAFIGVWRTSTNDDRRHQDTVDKAGLLLLIVAVGGLQLVLQRGIGRNWLQSPELIVEATLAALACCAFLLHSRGVANPILEVSVLKDRNFVAALVFNFVLGGTLFGTMTLVSGVMQGPLGLDPMTTGLAIAPRGLATMVIMLLMGRVIGRIDQRALLATGLLLSAASLQMMAIVPLNGGVSWIILSGLIQGTGAGCMFTPLSVLAFSTLPQALRTDGAGLYNLMRQLGCAVGVAIVASVLTAAIDWRYTGLLGQLDACAPSGLGCPFDRMGPSELMQRATLFGYLDDFHIMAIIVIATLPLLLFLRTAPSARSAAAAAAD